MKEKDLSLFLSNNPQYVGYKDGMISLCLLNQIVCYSHLGDIKRFSLKEETLFDDWVILKPVDFLTALRAWSAGMDILSKSNDSIAASLYKAEIQKDLGDIVFNGNIILNKQWFIVQKNF
jgi:hypothetical protein